MTTLSQAAPPPVVRVSMNVPLVLCTVAPTVTDCPKQMLKVCVDVDQDLTVRLVVTTLSHPLTPALMSVSTKVPLLLCTTAPTVTDCPKQMTRVWVYVGQSLTVRLVVTTLSQPLTPALMRVSMKVPLVLCTMAPTVTD